MKYLFSLLTFFILFTSTGESQYTIGADRFWLFHAGNTGNAYNKGMIWRNNAGDTAYYYDGTTVRVLYPQTSGSGGNFISTLIDSPDVWLTFYKHGDTITITSVDSAVHAGDAGVADSLFNNRQDVWKRVQATGMAFLTNPADCVFVGGNNYNPVVGSKMNFYLRNNGLQGIGFGGDSGLINTSIMSGRMNNQRLWGIRHTTANDAYETFILTPPSTINTFSSMTTTGFGINVQPVDAFQVAGNATIGTTSGGALTGSGNLRVRGYLNGGSQAAEGLKSEHTLEETNTGKDNLVLSQTTQDDSATGGIQRFYERRIAGFTSASAQTIDSYTLNWNITYVWEVTAFCRPNNKTGEYFSKKIFVTASNDSGTINFDTTTIATQIHDPFSELSTCDFIISTSTNTINFQVKGSATRQTNFTLYGNRSYYK